MAALCHDFVCPLIHMFVFNDGRFMEQFLHVSEFPKKFVSKKLQKRVYSTIREIIEYGHGYRKDFLRIFSIYTIYSLTNRKKEPLYALWA